MLCEHENDSSDPAARFGYHRGASKEQDSRAVSCLSPNVVATGEVLCRPSCHRRTSANKARPGNFSFGNSLLHQLRQYSFSESASSRIRGFAYTRTRSRGQAEKNGSSTRTSEGSAKADSRAAGNGIRYQAETQAAYTRRIEGWLNHRKQLEGWPMRRLLPLAGSKLVESYRYQWTF